MKPRLLLFLLCLLLTTCRKESDPAPLEEVDPADFLIPDWTDASHGNGTEPDYEIVFNQTTVKTLEISMGAESWQSVKSNMKDLSGVDFGISSGPGHAAAADPDYVAVAMRFEGKNWYKVGLRLKGNSSLASSWRRGIYKLPFRLNFDSFEDDFPQIKNQRFYGFKELSMSPGFNDNSLIREKAGADIFRMAGIPSSQTAFYKVYIDFGEGLKYCGVYTAVEVVDDTMIANQFGEDKGNIYKPESAFKIFSKDEFEKKNNKGDNDFTDVESTISVLNSTLRVTDPAAWRSQLEVHFNADHFLKWLAVNSGMMNWDTYGRMAHNYYLYNAPGKGLTWIPWDNNESMSTRATVVVSISQQEISTDWPLIRFLMQDPVYYQKYAAYVEDFKTNVFTTVQMNALFDSYHELISPYVIGPEEKESAKYTQISANVSSSFTNALQELKLNVMTQQQKMNLFLQ